MSSSSQFVSLSVFPYSGLFHVQSSPFCPPFLPVSVHHSFNVLGHDGREIKSHRLPHTHTVVILPHRAVGYVMDYTGRGISIHWNSFYDLKRLWEGEREGGRVQLAQLFYFRI